VVNGTVVEAEGRAAADVMIDSYWPRKVLFDLKYHVIFVT